MSETNCHIDCENIHNSCTEFGQPERVHIKDLKENRLELHVFQFISIVLNRFIRETYLYSSIYYYILNMLRYQKCHVTVWMKAVERLSL